MRTQPTDPFGDTNFQQVAERLIVQRTWGRVHGLQVEVLSDRLVVHGRTSTYYAKQLALEGAMEALGSTDASAVELDIQVGDGSPRVSQPNKGLWARA